uniref:Uncharacterized protein n=1 Tax=Steinernema glaseri TaxID=37863 RepID=A0A1I7YPB5_9BILA
MPLGTQFSAALIPVEGRLA